MVQRLILLAAATAIALGHAVASPPCEPPSGFENDIIVVDGDLVVTFAMDRFAYDPGDTVHFFLSVKNTGADSVHHPIGFWPFHSFHVYPDTCSTHDQEGCYDASPFPFPGLVWWSGGALVLSAGGCDSWSELWDGRDVNTDEQSVGSFNVFAGILQGHLQYVTPPHGARLQFSIGSVPVLPATWGLLKARYE